MNDKININLITYKAQRFGFNPKIIEYLLKVELPINIDMRDKFSHILKSAYDIEKSAQMSISK